MIFQRTIRRFRRFAQICCIWFIPQLLFFIDCYADNYIIEPAPSGHTVKIADIRGLLKCQEFIISQPDRIFNKPIGAKIPCSPVELGTFPKCRMGKSDVRRWCGGSLCMILTQLLEVMFRY